MTRGTIDLSLLQLDSHSTRGEITVDRGQDPVERDGIILLRRTFLCLTLAARDFFHPLFDDGSLLLWKRRTRGRIIVF